MKNKTPYWGLAIGASVLLAPQLPAQTRSQVVGDSATKQAQTLYAYGDMGQSTFDSKAAGSKETRASQAIELGGWLGEARVVGLRVRHLADDVAFSLNQSESKTSFTDVRFIARFFGIMPSVGVSLSEVDVERDGLQTVGLYGTGLNFGLGGTVSLYPGIVLTGDAYAVKSNHVFDKLDQEQKLGDRLEADLNIAFDITDRLLDLIVGYRMRQYEIETPTVTYAEKAQGIYAGVRLGVYF